MITTSCFVLFSFRSFSILAAPKKLSTTFTHRESNAIVRSLSPKRQVSSSSAAAASATIASRPIFYIARPSTSSAKTVSG
jgi:hypothetical protein